METYTYKLVEDEHGNIQCGDKLYRFEETIEEEKKTFETEEGDILYKCEDYHILSMQVYCVIEDNKHKIKTIVDYVKNQKHYRKVFENILESKGE